MKTEPALASGARRISVAEARRAIETVLPPPACETVPIQSASGRVLATEIRAAFSLPRFSNSAMDGFAVRASDLVGATREQPVMLSLGGVIAAGGSSAGAILPGVCIQIMTGAPIPPGADAVVMVEHTSGFEGTEVAFYEAPRTGQNVRREGEELGAGELLITPGTRIGPPELGILASFGHARVEVFRRPRVSILATGDELRQPGEPLGAGEIYDSNRFVLADLVSRAGADLARAERLRDVPGRLESVIEAALGDSDVIALSGGVSMGRYDHVRPALLAVGVRDHFWRINQRPGGPLFFGTHGQRLIFGLPGNPVSSFIGFMEYAWPAIDALSGTGVTALLTAELASSFPRLPAIHRFLFGRVSVRDGRFVADPSRKLGSNMLSSSLEANAILSAPPGDGDLPAGSAIDCRLLPWATPGPA